MGLQRLTVAQRVVLWDGLLTRLRGTLHEQGLREVQTPVRIVANAVEPWIEPLDAAGKQLRTSPELAMKRLLAGGAGPIFEVAAVFRSGEEGPRHREEFHLLEWYRLGADATPVQADVERVVAVAREATDEALQRAPREPFAWVRRGFLDLFEATTGVRLRGDERPGGLAELLDGVRARAGLRPTEYAPALAPDGVDAEELEQLAAWTELFSLWSDLELDPWLAARPGRGLHLVEFPAPLAALARRRGALAERFESYVATERGSFELANGYVELADPVEQRHRFELVNGLRLRHGQPALPLDPAFLEALGRLPDCAGAALGLERLLMVAADLDRIGDLALP